MPSVVVNCHFILASLLFRWICQALTSVLIVLISSILLFRHCFVSTMSPISAMFNQLPYSGIQMNSGSFHILFAYSGSDVSYNAAALCEARLSITSVMISVSGYNLSNMYFTNSTRSFFILLLVP